MNEPVRVAKLMSLTLAEFQHTVAPLCGAPLPAGSTRAVIPLGAGHVAIAYEPQPSVRLGGLIDMPRATVSLEFTGAGEAERSRFLDRFELFFRRGGG